MQRTAAATTMPSTVPRTMRAAVADAPGPPEVLHLGEVPVPRLKRDRVLIALDFSSVGIWDAKERAGEWRDIVRGTILGADGTGTVAAVGHDVERFRTGDRVYSYSYDNPDGGFYAEFVSVHADLVAHVPPQLMPDVAGAIPCVGLTALSGLETLGVKREQTLLVFGASGGVGSLAVWLAGGMKAVVVGTARPDAHAYVQSLGAAHVIDPHDERLNEKIRQAAPNGFDAALVTANGDSLPAFFAHLKPRAPVAYPDGVEPEPVAERHRVIAFDGEMSRDAFARLNAAIGNRIIPLRVTPYALDDVVEAHRRIERGHVVGKLVLRIR